MSTTELIEWFKRLKAKEGWLLAESIDDAEVRWHTQGKIDAYTKAIGILEAQFDGMTLCKITTTNTVIKPEIDERRKK